MIIGSYALPTTLRRRSGTRALREYAAQDPRIKWTRREQNGDISDATNCALDLASGEFVALMDHDDVFRNTAL